MRDGFAYSRLTIGARRSALQGRYRALARLDPHGLLPGIWCL